MIDEHRNRILTFSAKMFRVWASLKRVGRNRFVFVGSVVGATAAGLYALDVLNERKFKEQMVNRCFRYFKTNCPVFSKVTSESLTLIALSALNSTNDLQVLCRRVKIY